jgi:F-type H+-transporting ATPase subunit b
MAHHLLQQIKPMMSDLKQAAGNPVQAVVTSHDPLPRATQDELSSGLRVVFPNIAMRFDTDEEQAPGLTLQVGGAQLVWSVDTYIDGLNALVHEELERSDGR